MAILSTARAPSLPTAVRFQLSPPNAASAITPPAESKAYEGLWASADLNRSCALLELLIVTD